MSCKMEQNKSTINNAARIVDVFLVLNNWQISVYKLVVKDEFHSRVVDTGGFIGSNIWEAFPQLVCFPCS